MPPIRRPKIHITVLEEHACLCIQTQCSMKRYTKKNMNIARTSLTFCTLQHTWPVKQFPAHFAHAENKAKIVKGDKSKAVK